MSEIIKQINVGGVDYDIASESAERKIAELNEKVENLSSGGNSQDNWMWVADVSIAVALEELAQSKEDGVHGVTNFHTYKLRKDKSSDVTNSSDYSGVSGYIAGLGSGELWSVKALRAGLDDFHKWGITLEGHNYSGGTDIDSYINNLCEFMYRNGVVSGKFTADLCRINITLVHDRAVIEVLECTSWGADMHMYQWIEGRGLTKIWEHTYEPS